MIYKEMSREEKKGMFKYTFSKGLILFFGMTMVSIMSYYEHNSSVKSLVLQIAGSLVLALLTMIPVSAYYRNSGDFDKEKKQS